ncbi:hypothetical protein, conserved [Trypanosoma brucei gambiense DAL972]|uniref:Uncharacterized protein n=1 Tax=Trypanosoma brucei gambiense (strain MHOM/CI/86/DAL972) TaxID=679716 RepID=D0A8M5_TRYB9|nr:hypothetical protein, conserved [Trypanosoma brucei gambiense DAL972]CBH18026.1 hypothetical protein, conserved [Trypanosoma brucei gambiense DAL972]|eukprot:XP_011780290.1 hypothetical protein, conserved [Trypanosoma brucei gambiense DAL972]
MKSKDVEDAGCVGQWIDNRKRASDDADSFVKSAMTISQSASSIGASAQTLRNVDRGRKRSESSKKSAGKKTSSAPSLLPQIKVKSAKQGKATGRPPISASNPSGGARKGSLKGKATGSISLTSQSTGGGSVGKRGKSPKSRGGAKGGKKRPSSIGRPSSRGSKGSSRRGSRLSRGSGRTSTKGKGGRNSRGKKGKKSKRSKSFAGADKITYAISSLTLAEEDQRSNIWAMEETERDALLPDYHLLVINMLRAQVVEVNARQQSLNDAFMSRQGNGLNFLLGDDPAAALELLRTQIRLEMQGEVEKLASANAVLSGLLEEKKAELEEKTNEAQSLQDKVNRRLARFEVDCEALRTEVQSALKTERLDIDRMKRELIRRLDMATAALRTPKYDTALRSMQALVQSVQDEIQEHHDNMSKLIVSIEAQDTFVRNKSDTMHSNFPVRYREELRKLDNDKLLNLLDILSFHDSVVETVGKTLYVISSTGYATNVF